MTGAAVGLLLSTAATLWAIKTDNATLMVLGFFAFALALAAGDHSADAINDRASDALDTLDRHRIGYDGERRW